MPHPQIKSEKQFIRLWYEFYQLCQREPDLKPAAHALETSYRGWGDGTATFDAWWETHKQSFAPAKVERVKAGHERAGWLLLEVPLGAPLTQSMSQVRALIRAAQEEQLAASGIDPAVRKSGALRFNRKELAGKETRGRTMYEALIVYRHWLNSGRPAVNEAFAQSLLRALEARKRSSWLPHVLVPRDFEDGKARFDDDQVRQVRRLRDRGRVALEKVREGQPPHY